MQAIYDYVHFHMVPGPDTIYEGVRKLEPGTLLLWRNGRCEIQTYWKPQYVEDERRPFGELKDEFLTALRSAVRENVADRNVGTFLSGGTDSSTLAGLLGEATGSPARTYSIGFQAEGFDETRYARIAAKHFGTRHREYCVTADDVVAAIPSIAAVHDQPFGNASAVPTYYCARLAKEDGIDTLLGGDGGDELFGGNSRYALQYVYSLYSDLPRILRERFLEPLAFALPPMGLIGLGQRYMRSAMLGMPGRYDKFNLLEQLGAEAVFTPEFLSGVDRFQPRREMERVYNDARASSLINRMLALDWKFTLADNDLPKVMRSCELAGVAARFPMLTDSVVDFAARLAPGLKLNRTRLRYFFKKALRGYLPEEILKKQKHGFGLPFGRWLISHGALEEVALDSLAALKKRQIVRGEFIDELMSRHVETQPDYHGTMVWVLMMLEQWFSRAMDTASENLEANFRPSAFV
jgi:asparagine synthase (glutamine-hydrolysing)